MRCPMRASPSWQSSKEPPSSKILPPITRRSDLLTESTDARPIAGHRAARYNPCTTHLALCRRGPLEACLRRRCPDRSARLGGPARASWAGTRPPSMGFGSSLSRRSSCSVACSIHRSSCSMILGEFRSVSSGVPQAPRPPQRHPSISPAPDPAGAGLTPGVHAPDQVGRGQALAESWREPEGDDGEGLLQALPQTRDGLRVPEELEEGAKSSCRGARGNPRALSWPPGCQGAEARRSPTESPDSISRGGGRTGGRCTNLPVISTITHGPSLTSLCVLHETEATLVRSRGRA